jgi:hypothetical protein
MRDLKPYLLFSWVGNKNKPMVGGHAQLHVISVLICL